MSEKLEKIILELEQANALMKSQCEASPDGILLVDSDKRMKSFNRNFVEMWGIPEGVVASGLDDRALASVLDKLLDPDEFLEKVNYLYEHPEERSQDELNLKDGRIFERYSGPVFDPQGSYAGRIWFFRDITERKAAEREAIRSRDHLRALYDGSSDCIFVMEENGRTINANRNAEEVFGYSVDEMHTLDIGEYFCEDPVEPQIEAYIRQTLRGEKVQFEGRCRRKNGEEFPAEVRFQALGASAESHGGPRRILVTVSDISQRMELEEHLHRTELRYRDLMNMTADGLFLADHTGRFVAVNQAACDNLGYSREELLELSIKDLVPEPILPTLPDSISEIRSRGGAIFETPHRRKDGSTMPVEIRARVCRVGNEEFFISSVRDITERLKAESALRESEEKFRTAFMISPDSITIKTTEDNRYIEVNQGFEQVTGYSRDEVIGRTPVEIGILFDDDRVGMNRDLEAKGLVDNLGTKYRMKDGTVRDGLISARIIRLGGVPHILSIMRDISDLKKAEGKIRSSLREKDILLREIHHRVKNNLQVVAGLINFQSNYIDDERTREYFLESEDRIRAIAIIHEELYRSKDLSSIDFSTHVRKLSDNLVASHSPHAGRVHLDLDLSEARLVLDTAIPCSLVITELISNAISHAFGEGEDGTIRIRFNPTEPEGYYLEVSDNGKGFPEDLDFRNTRSMGLQLVCLLVEQLGGHIQMTRKGGTTFKINFKEYHEAGSELH